MKNIFNNKKINKSKQVNKLGFNKKDGYNSNGVNKFGFHKENKKDCIEYILKNIKDVNRFCKLYNNYINKNTYGINLAECYLFGVGTMKNVSLGFHILIEEVFNSPSVRGYALLSFCYEYGIVLNRNKFMRPFIDEVIKGNYISSIYQYCPMPVNLNYDDILIKSEQICLDEIIKLIKTQNFLELQAEETRLEKWKDFGENEIENKKIYRQGKVKIGYRKEKIEQFIKSPYIGKLKVPSLNIPLIYISKQNEIPDINTNEFRITTWHNSELYEMWRSNFADESVTLKRDIEISNSYVKRVTDRYNNDDILQKQLEQHLQNGRSGYANDIIMSMQPEQLKLVKQDNTRNIIVQGCAGSGKTQILLHRVSDILFKMKQASKDNSSTKNIYNDFKAVIITPSENLKEYIAEECITLNIQKIPLKTMNEYIIELFNRYTEQLQKYDWGYADVGLPGDNHNLRNKPFHFKINIRSVLPDYKLSQEILKYIYSEDFSNDMRLLTGKANHEKVDDFWEMFMCIMKCKFDDNIEFETRKPQMKRLVNNKKSGTKLKKIKLLTSRMKCKVKITKRYYTCVLYARLLYLYLCFGKIIKKDTLLVIDEGQDYPESLYKLINLIHGERLKWNIFGDVNQSIYPCISINNWKKVSFIKDKSYFEISNNYRNSKEITQFYNDALNKNDLPMGISTQSVQNISNENLEDYLKLNLILHNRMILLAKDTKQISAVLKKTTIPAETIKSQIRIMTPYEAKGLEFDVAFVLDSGMSLNEKYIAYTRGIFCLYIIDCNRKNIFCNTQSDDGNDYDEYQKYIDNLTSDNDIKTSEQVQTANQQSRQCKFEIRDLIVVYNTHNSEHSLQEIDASVEIIRPNGKSIEQHFEAYYCENCNEFFVYYEDFKHLKKMGVIKCRIIDGTNHINSSKEVRTNLREKSELAEYGYTVQKGKLTKIQRQAILEEIIYKDILNSYDIISHLEWLIDFHYNRDNMHDAISSWKEDISYINNLTLEGKIRVGKFINRSAKF